MHFHYKSTKKQLEIFREFALSHRAALGESALQSSQHDVVPYFLAFAPKQQPDTKIHKNITNGVPITRSARAFGDCRYKPRPITGIYWETF